MSAPDVPPQNVSRANAVLGWSFSLHRFNGAHGPWLNDAVYPSWSAGTVHGTGHDPSRNEERGSRSQYSTKALALRGLRAALKKWSADKLAVVDAAISKADQ